MRPEYISALLVALGAIGTWLSVILTRRGKREDVRLQRVDQVFDHMKELAETRSADITRLTVERDSAYLELDRTRNQWEDRWERQMVRCRAVTASLVDAIAALRKLAGPNEQKNVQKVLRALNEHNEDDHPES